MHHGFGPGAGVLWAALNGGQEKDVLVKIMRKGGYIGVRVIHIAVQKERVDILPLLLRVGGGLVEEEELEEWTNQTGNEEVESLVEAFTKGGIKGLAEYEKGRKEEARKKIRWWQ